MSAFSQFAAQEVEISSRAPDGFGSVPPNAQRLPYGELELTQLQVLIRGIGDAALKGSTEERRDGARVEETTKLLGSAGLTSSDLKLFHDLQMSGFSTFVHGSIVTGALQAKSDVDFAVVGDFSGLSPDLRAELFPGLGNTLLDRLDYVSASRLSERGKKISFHIEKPSFRDDYPNIDRPYAYEYRPVSHAKREGVSRYLLGGIDASGTAHILRFTCPQEAYVHGTVNVIPQTGVFSVSDNVASCGSDPSISFPIDYITTVDAAEGVAVPYARNGKDILVLGLEFDKITSDTPLFYENSDRYVKSPLQRTIAAVEAFAAGDPINHINGYFQQLANHWDIIKT